MTETHLSLRDAKVGDEGKLKAGNWSYYQSFIVISVTKNTLYLKNHLAETSLMLMNSVLRLQETMKKDIL